MSVAEKWGVEVARRGFAQIPNYLLLINQFVDEDFRLNPVELLVLFQLAGAWWRKDSLPYPSMSTLAARCGVSTRQIQRAVNRLEKMNFIQRVKRRTKGVVSTNAYNLEPLAKILDDIAKAFPNEFPRAKVSGERKPYEPPPSPFAEFEEEKAVEQKPQSAKMPVRRPRAM